MPEDYQCQERRGQVKTMVMKHYNGILFQKTETVNKQHTNQSINMNEKCSSLTRDLNSDYRSTEKCVIHYTIQVQVKISYFIFFFHVSLNTDNN